jgi:hypothetical protein
VLVVLVLGSSGTDGTSNTTVRVVVRVSVGDTVTGNLGLTVV